MTLNDPASLAPTPHRMTSPAGHHPTCSDGGCSTVPGAAEIDASFRFPALLVAFKSAAWLVLGALLLLVASVKLHGPGMLSGKPWLTYGRLLPAGWDVLVYGFAGQAAAITGLWVLARAVSQRLQAPILVLAGLALWNVGVLAGLVGILCGESTGREWLEMPPGAMSFLVFGAALMGVSGWMTYSARTNDDAYPSAWFSLLALLSFVWFGTVALSMLGGEGSRGVVQVLVQRWFATGISKLWLGGFAIAIIFHFLPTLVGRPLASRQLALIAFWSLAFFTPWSVTHHGDPFPRWLVSVGLAGRFLASIGWIALGMNWCKTTEKVKGTVPSTLAGRMIGAAAIALLTAWALDLLTSFLGMASVVRLTWTQAGIDWLLVGAVILAVQGALPELLSRSLGRPLSAGLLNAHSWLTLVGIGLASLPLVLAGLVQGRSLSNGTTGFVEALGSSMHLVRLNSLGLTLFFIGQLAFVGAVLGLARHLVLGCVTTVARWAASVPGGKTAGVRS